MSSNLGDEGNSSGGGNTTNNNNANFPLWKYVTESVRDGKAGGNTAFQCNYCQRTFKGSYSRGNGESSRRSGVENLYYFNCRIGPYPYPSVWRFALLAYPYCYGTGAT
ncbi:unnamed protein product [Prunus armeniaca]